jgi:hypothetical protein
MHIDLLAMTPVMFSGEAGDSVKQGIPCKAEPITSDLNPALSCRFRFTSDHRATIRET